MASPSISAAPRCLACVRRLGLFSDVFSSPVRQQIRGKKKVAKDTTIIVQLIKDVPGYGRKGSIIPVARGLMRNTWLEKKMATYVTVAKLEDSVITERDRAFTGVTNIKPAEIPQSVVEIPSDPDLSAPADPDPLVEVSPPPPAELFNKLFGDSPPTVVKESDQPNKNGNPMEPEGKPNPLSRLLPPKIEFFGTLPPVASVPLKKLSPSLSAGAALSKEAASVSGKTAAEGNPASPKELKKAVTTADIAANLNAILKSTKEGRGIMVLPGRISFVGTKRKDAVTHLGTFEFDISLDGGSETIRREVMITAGKQA